MSTYKVKLNQEWGSATEAANGLRNEVIDWVVDVVVVKNDQNGPLVIDMENVYFSTQEFGFTLVDQLKEDLSEKFSPEKAAEIWDRVTVQPVTDPAVMNIIEHIKPNVRMVIA